MQKRILYKEALNPAQLEAVNFNNGSLLVIAGAGSGKTRTLTYRVARLVEEGISPSAILLLTFTRKAAGEMVDRATALLDNRCKRVSGGTFHSFANTVLRKHASSTGNDHRYTIIDRVDSEGLISMLRKEIASASLSKHAFPNKKTLANIFSKSVNKVLPVEDIVMNDYPHFSMDLDTIIDLNIKYQKQKIQHNFFDYDDLLIKLKELLEKHPDIRHKISSMYSYIMVDEYQDTNKLQAEIVNLLSCVNKNIMVVGDDSQSIYAFRGANFKNIMKFPQSFPGTKIIRLEENYRSIQPILDVTNAIIEQAAEKYSKKLFTKRPGNSKPVLVSAASENSQSLFIVDKIESLRKNGVPLNKIAVLIRAGFHSFDLEIELGLEGIPFIKVGGFKFMESAHIKDLLAHLRAYISPLDKISWYRILLLLDKVGPKTAQTIYEDMLHEKNGYNGLFNLKFKPGPAKGLERLKDFFAQIDSPAISVSQLGATALQYYTPILKQKYDDHPKRTRDLEHLLTIMERYNDLEHFLTDMALEPPNTSSAAKNLFTDKPNDDRLTISTVHSAKGLEWHTVFVLWALDGRFPSIHSLNDEEELEEELRLMYVAATRARENLFFTYPVEIYDKISRMFLTRPSRFIDMLPDDLLEKQWCDY